MQFASPSHGIGAYLQIGDLQDMIEEQIFVSQPVRSQEQQRQQTVRKQEFSQNSQLKFCLPTPAIFQNQRPPPLKIVNSTTLNGMNKKLGKVKRPFSAKGAKVSKSALSWKSPPFIKTSRTQTKQSNKNKINKSANKFVQWDSNVQQTKLFDDIKRNTLERQMILQQKRLAQTAKNNAASQFGGLTVSRNEIQAKTLIEFQGKNQGTTRKLQVCHDSKLLNDGGNKSATVMAAERRQILRQRQKREKQLKQKQALLFKERASMFSHSGTLQKGGKKDIIIAKPALSALQQDEIEIRKNEEIMMIDDRKLDQLRAGIDLNLQKRDEMILDLRNQFETLLQNRKTMNQQFVKKIEDMQKEKLKIKQTMLKKAQENTIKGGKIDKDEIPTRDPGFTKKKVSQQKKQSTNKLSPQMKKKKQASIVQNKPRHPNQLLSQAMIKHQIDRQVQLDYQKKVTQRILLSMRENPNSQLYLMQKEVDALTQKLAPVMERVQATVSNMNELSYVRHKSNSIGMVSRMAGKFMAMNADKIVDLLLDQLLQETVKQLDNIEQEMRQNIQDDESKEAAEHLLELLGQFNYQADQAEQKLFCGQLTNELKQRKQKKIKKYIEFQGIELSQQGQAYQHPFNLQPSKNQAPQMSKKQVVDIEDQQLLVNNLEDRYKLENIRFRDKQEIKYTGQVQLLINKDMKLSQLPEEVYRSIQSGMLRYSQYLIRANGSDNEQVWKLYDHICNDLFAQIFSQAVKVAQVDIESALEGMIAEEILAIRK